MATENWRRRAERAERENAVLRAEMEKAWRVYGEQSSAIVSLKIAIERTKALLEEAIGEINA